jgi:hypothetical protein
MKNFRSLVGGWVVVLGLWGGIFTVDAGAQEVAADAGLALPASKAAQASQLCRCGGDSEASVTRIRQVLSEPLKSEGLEFTEVPLERVMDFLQEEYNLPIHLDESAMEDAGLTRDEPLTVQIQNVSLQSALRMALHQKLLTYMVRNGVIIITTPEVAENDLKVCVYDVRDLVGRNEDNNNLDALVDTLICCVATNSWAKKGGGEAEIKALQPGVLVISQSDTVHDLIGGVLSQIRETLEQPAQTSRVLTPREMRAMVLEGVEGGMGGMPAEMGMAEEPASQPEPTPADSPFE